MSESDLIERLADELGKRLKPAVPLNVALWTTDDIGAYLQRSPRVVAERIVTLQGFPKPIRLPSASADAECTGRRGKSNPLWEANEVIQWAKGHKEKAVGRPRKELL